MLLLIIFAFLAGVVTILSPCILPVLPIILSSSVGGSTSDKSRPFGVVTGFVLSFTFFTLFLSTLVRLSGIPSDSLRNVSIIIIAGFGISLLIPQFQALLEKMFARVSNLLPKSTSRTGFGGGLLLGLSLGLLWTPCVGPILASVISLALIGTVSLDTFFITLAYSIGTAIPMFAIIWGGRQVFHRSPWLLSHLGTLQKFFGLLMILTAIGIYLGIDRRFQNYILNTFPSYGLGLTQFEDNPLVRQQLNGNNDSPPIGDSTMAFPTVPEIIPGGDWFNSQPLTLRDLRGQVVLVDFWTYSCINCQRTLPYLQNWYQKYHDQGFVIIGVHSPEFEFEKDPENVTRAIKDFHLTYPIVQDNNFATWKAYSNHYWPAKYLIDKNGRIRYTHFGEGDYNETESVIQELLKETGADVSSESISNPDYQTYSQTPETYLGYARIAHFASPQALKKDAVNTYTLPDNLGSNQIAFRGDWFVAREYAQPSAGSALVFNFSSQQVFLVMRPHQDSARVKVFVDDELQFFGADNKEGIVTVDKDTLYRLINLPSPGRHQLRLEFEDGNAELYAFTFG